MATGSTSILNYFRPVGSSLSSTTQTLPDLDGPLSEKVPAKAIKLANTEVKQSKELSRGQRLPRECCSLHYKGNLGLVFSIFTLIHQSFTIGPPLASGGLNFCFIFQVADLPKFYAANVSRYTVATCYMYYQLSSRDMLCIAIYK